VQSAYALVDFLNVSILEHAAFASISASSFPIMPLCAGIHAMTIFRCGERYPSAFNSFELPSWMLYQDVQLLWDSGLVRGESGYSL
jgi:hypothetical protein